MNARLPLDASTLADAIDRKEAALEAQVITWRRVLRQHPELGNPEFRTAGIVVDHLRALCLEEVPTGVAHTGVVGLLKGDLPGPVVALSADMDGLRSSGDCVLFAPQRWSRQMNGRACERMRGLGHDHD